MAYSEYAIKHRRACHARMQACILPCMQSVLLHRQIQYRSMITGIKHDVAMGVTRPQFKTCLYARSIYSQHHSHNSSHAHRYFLHPHFKMQAKGTTQVGTKSVVCLSGLELTVKHTQTPFHFFGIYLLFTLYRTQPEQCLSNPNYRHG